MKWITIILLAILISSCEKDQFGTYEYRLHGTEENYTVLYFDQTTGEHTEIVKGYWTHSGEIIDRTAFYLECQDTTAMLYLYLFYDKGGGVVIKGKRKIYSATWN